MPNITVPGAVSGANLGIADKQVLTASLPAASPGVALWQIPARIGSITVQVYVTSAGSYYVEVTASPIEDVVAGTADWFDLFGANQSASRQQAIFSSVTALRVTRVSGEFRACIRGQ